MKVNQYTITYIIKQIAKLKKYFSNPPWFLIVKKLFINIMKNLTYKNNRRLWC